MTGDLLREVTKLTEAFPQGNIEDVIETSVLKLEGKLPTVTDAQLALEQQSLKRLEKALGLYEIAAMLYDIDEGKSLATAVNRTEAKHNETPTLAWAMKNPQAYREKDEENMENDTLLDALEEALDAADEGTLEDLLEKLKSRRKIRLGVNRSKISDNRLGFNKHVRDFNSLVNKPINDFNRLAGLHREGEQLTDQEFTVLAEDVLNSDNEGHFVSEDTSFRIRQIMIQKAAEKRDRQNAEKKRTDFLRNRLANEALTPAQKSIEAHEFEPDEAPLSAFLPKEFAPKIEASTDNSFVAQMKAGRMKSSTKAAATIARPVASKAGFKSNVDNDKGNIAANQTHRQAAAAASQMSGPETYTPAGQKKTSQPQYVADLVHLSSPIRRVIGSLKGKLA